MEIEVNQIKSVPVTFIEKAKERGNRTAMRHKEYGLWHDISWNEYLQQSTFLAHALINLGVEQGDFVGIIGENCPEWLFMDMGIQMAGARTVGIYTTSPWQQVQYILEHSECKVLFAENEEQVDKWLQMRDKLPSLQYVIYWDKKGLERLEEPGLLYYDLFMEKGKNSFNTNPTLHMSRVEKSDPDDIAILVYTSGTTGQPKGAMITGKNLLWTAERLKAYGDNVIGEKDHTLSFLPLCHIFERMFGVYLHIAVGFTVNYVESPETIAQNLTEVRPTFCYAVPRMWEKFQSSIMLKMADAPWLNRVIFKTAMKISGQYTEKALKKEKISAPLAIMRFFAYWSVIYPLKYMVGMNRIVYALSGAAPISPKVLNFYHMLGITLFEGYGMTETSCIISISLASKYKLGTVGQPIAQSEVKIAEDGEILVKHPGVISGYYKDPVGTSEAIIDHWLRTGDVGKIDEEGYLSIVDRKKDIIITAGGKNIAPQKIESKLKVSSFINDAIVIGDNRKYLTAIIVLDEENINKYARDHKIQYTAYSELAAHEDIRKLIDREIQEVNKELARVENLRKYTILDKRLYVEDGEVTPTMKVKRKFINEEYKDIIEKMYV